MTPKATVKTLETPSDTMTVYGVYIAGELVGKIEKHVYADRKRFAGQMYGYDTTPKAHYRVTEVRGRYAAYQMAWDSRKAAVNALLESLEVS